MCIFSRSWCLTQAWSLNTAAAALERCGVAATGATAAVRRIAHSTLAYNMKFKNARRKLYSMLDEHPHDPG